MAKLIYAANISLDGYMEDERGNIEWAISNAETYAFWTDFQRPDRHLPLRAPNVRDDGVLGDGEHQRRSAGG